MLMMSEEELEKLTYALTLRMQRANTLFLEKIGENIKKIRNAKKSDLQKIVQSLKYGEDYEYIIRQISELTKISEKEIYDMFYEVAKKDQYFSKKFYEYRSMPFIDIAKNEPLKRQVIALAKITYNDIAKINKTSSLGYSIKDELGNTRFLGLRDTYNKAIDDAIINISQGKATFDEAMYYTLKQIGGNGLKTVDFESGRSVRLDSIARQNIMYGVRNLHNEIRLQLGREFGADGVEITVHENPAPDHAEVQGRQFSNEEFDKFQNDKEAKDYKGKIFPPEFDGHDRRSISEYNCQHWIISVILGVNKPRYTNEQLQNIINKNNIGFEIDGKKYTMYEGQQLQRKMESEIRKYKDLQILGKASDNDKLIIDSQKRITELNTKYNELCKKSGLKRQSERLAVIGYKRVAIKK